MKYVFVSLVIYFNFIYISNIISKMNIKFSLSYVCAWLTNRYNV